MAPHEAFLISIWDRIAEDNLDGAAALIEEFEIAMDAVYHPDTKPLEIVRVLLGMRDVASLL